MIALLLVTRLVLAFSSQWSTHFNSSGDLNLWQRFQMNCSGQNHAVSGGAVQMRANYGTDCFGAFYRDNAVNSGTFPADQDVRVMWRWRYPAWGKYGTQAGQVTGRYGGPQYYGVSAVDTGNGDTDFAHVESSGTWGSWNVDNPMWRSGSRDSGWHTSTFDFICDGRQLAWWLDGSRIHQVSNGPALPAGHESRPYQFWYGNLISSVPENGDWTGFDLDYVYIYTVQRPQMNPLTPGSGGSQPASWQAVSNTPQPDGSTWNVQYQARACTDPNCTSVVSTTPWQNGTSHTFSGLEVNRTYYYQVRARWAGSPELITCWGNTVSATNLGRPALNLAKSATAAAGPGQVIRYTLIVQNPGSSTGTGVIVRDPLPLYLTNPTNISSGGTVQGSDIVWQIASLPAGQSRTLSWQGTVELSLPATVTELVNIATATDDDGNQDEAQASTRLLVPGIELAKNAPAEVKPGEIVSYTLSVANTGNMTLPDVVVRDPLPSYVTNPTHISHGGTLQGSELNWDIGPLSPGERLILSWQGLVDPLIPVTETDLTNRARVETGLDLSAEAEATSRVLQPQLRVSKQASPTVRPGESVDYVITVANTGNTTIFQLQLADLLPAYVTPVAGTISTGGYEVPDRIIWDNFDDLPPGASIQVTWQGRVDPLVPPELTELHNVVSATAGGELNETAEAISDLLQPGLTLTKEASFTAYAGGEIQFMLTVANNGPGLARQIEVRDPLPAYTGFVPDVAPHINNYGRLEGSDVIWQLNELEPGQAVTLRWRGQVNLDVPPGVTEIVNQNACVVSLDTPEPVCAKTVTQLLDPGLSLNHTCPAFAQAGDSLTYGVRVENASTGTTRQVVVRAPLPPGTQYRPASASHAGRLIGGELVWELGTLAAGAVVELSFTLDLPPDLAGQVVSTVQAETIDRPALSRSCQTALAIPTLSVVKIAPEQVLANEVIEYMLQVENTGPVVAHHVVLTDSLPAGATYVPGSASYGGLVSDTELVWQVGELALDQVATRRFQMIAQAPQGVGDGQIYNEAVATADRAVPVRTSTLTQVPRPELHLAKSAPAAVEPGGTIQYTLRGGNAGPGLARQVIIKDTVPAGMVVLEDTITDAGYYHAGEHSVSWPLGELTAGSTVERGFAVLVPPTMRPGSRSLDNTAYISSPDAAPVYAYATTAISGTFTVAGLKRASAYTRPGEPIDYAIQVHNGSPTLVANVMIRDPLPEYTTYLTETASLPPAFADDGRTLIWTLGTLAAGETREVHFRTQVSGEVPDWLDRVTNLAQVAYSSGSFEVRAVTLLPAGVVTQEEPPTPVPPTPTPGPRSDPPSAEPTLTPLPTSPPVVELTPSSPTITPEATPLPVPGLHKTVSPAVVRAGQISDVSWKLNFSNPTPLTIGGLVIRDPLPAGLVYVSSQTSQGQVGATGSLSQTVVVANIGDLPPGGRVEVVILTQVLSTTRPAVYANTGRYSGLNLEPGVSNEAKLVVERGTVLLPITGGLLDPHTRIGKIAWGGGALLLLVLARSGLLKFLKL